VAAWLLAIRLVGTATMHFVSPGGFERIVPHFMGAPPFWVFVRSDHDLFHNPVVAWARLPSQIPLIAWALYIAKRAERRARSGRIGRVRREVR
jgi:uncharacterized membrane protein